MRMYRKETKKIIESKPEPSKSLYKRIRSAIGRVCHRRAYKDLKKEEQKGTPINVEKQKRVLERIDLWATVLPMEYEMLKLFHPNIKADFFPFHYATYYAMSSFERIVWDDTKMEERCQCRRLSSSNTRDYRGKIMVFSEYMCVYRFDAEGSWSSMYWKKGLEFRLGFLLKEAEWMRELDVETDKKYQKAIHEHLLPQLHVLFLFGKISGKEYLHSVFVVGGRKNYYLMMKGFKKRLVAFLRQRVIE